MSISTRLDRIERQVAALQPAAIPADAVALMQAAGIEPDPWQREVLQSTASRLLLNCSRQVGKSTTTSGLAVQTALTQPRSLVLLLSPSQRQSAELLNTCATLYRAVGRPIVAESESTLQLRLANGSRIIALPGKEATVRGYAGVALLVIDEAARVPDGLYYSIRPMLAVSGGRLIALSTPFGTQGWWYEAWAAGGAEWERYEVPATLCPRITAEFLAQERRGMGEWWYRQEYCCQFMDAQGAVFRREVIDAMFDDTVEVWSL